MPFLTEADTLIMSPALFDQKPVRKPEDLPAHIFLATETRPGDWVDWLDHAGLSHLAGQRRRIFDHFFVTLQAVIDGLGLETVDVFGSHTGACIAIELAIVVRTVSAPDGVPVYVGRRRARPS